MALTMAKRGPDGQGIWNDSEVGLAFRRLAIIDLHERSNQPLHLGPLHLVFNGEIYNYRELREELRRLGHRFATEGDGEVLLHAWQAWGEASLGRLNGMFAFAVWDDCEHRLTLASDPFGEKPLYWWWRKDGRLAFASEIKALLQDPLLQAEPDHDALAPYLAHSAMPAPERSFFQGIARLPGAHLLRWRNAGVEVERYWWPRRVDVPASPEAAARELRGLLLDSVRLRLRSDVPVGTSLSGGLDSSAVVALSAHIAGEHRRHAFTATFPGFDLDEWTYADATATSAGVVEHHAVRPTAADLLADLTDLVRDHEEPVRSSSVYAQWRVNAAAREAGVVVLLDGQGADEVLAGYRHLWGPALRSVPAREAARALVRDRTLLAPLALSFGADHLPGWAAAAYRKRSSTPYASAALAERSISEAVPWNVRLESDGNPLRRALVRDAFVTSLPSLLRYADRSSMAHSREVRLPFLDRRLVELILSLPASWIYCRGRPKWVLRAAVGGDVPRAVAARRDKIGFDTPQRRWLAEPAFRERIGEVLLDPGARGRGLYQTAVIERDLRARSWRDPDGIWRALNTELWLTELVQRRQ
jgi:asparagine synthase (glutamine-hydrolysing)